MSESRICPVCENEIPEDARFLCPHCHFELKWLDDDGEIEKARKIFNEGNQTKPEKHDSQETFQDENISKLKHFIPSALGILVYSIWFESKVGHFYGCFFPIIGLPAVLVVGIFSYQLEKAFIRDKPGISRVLFLLPVIFLILFWIFMATNL